MVEWVPVMLYALLNAPGVTLKASEGGRVDPWEAALGTRDSDCAGAERWAVRQMSSAGARRMEGATGWATRFRGCPFAPHVGTMAMIETWTRPETLPQDFEVRGLDVYQEARHEKRRLLVAWGRAVQAEFTRRGLATPSEVFSISAGALLGMGDVEAAAKVWESAVARGALSEREVSWMVGVSALITLRHEAGLRALGRDLGSARRHVSPAATRAVYLRAVFLDRLGDRQGAAVTMRDAQAADKDQRALRGLV
ncbi:MAG: hypothetical protein ACPHRO_03640, partial [Nannocystaceae bacterium]